MRRRIMTMLGLALLAITPLLASCADQSSSISAPEVTQSDAAVAGLSNSGTGSLDQLSNSGSGSLDQLSNRGKGSLENPITLLSGVSLGEPVEAWIGRDGGVLRTGTYRLVVPRGAVIRPTLFRMAPTNDLRIAVDLYAFQHGLDGQLVEVGSKGFRKPLSITMSYASATNIVENAKLLVVHVREDGQLVPQACNVDNNEQTLTARLQHFSRYALAQN